MSEEEQTSKQTERLSKLEQELKDVVFFIGDEMASMEIVANYCPLLDYYHSLKKQYKEITGREYKQITGDDYEVERK
jgi:hypothetical protein